MSRTGRVSGGNLAYFIVDKDHLGGTLAVEAEAGAVEWLLVRCP